MSTRRRSFSNPLISVEAFDPPDATFVRLDRIDSLQERAVPRLSVLAPAPSSRDPPPRSPPAPADLAALVITSGSGGTQRGAGEGIGGTDGASASASAAPTWPSAPSSSWVSLVAVASLSAARASSADSGEA